MTIVGPQPQESLADGYQRLWNYPQDKCICPEDWDDSRASEYTEADAKCYCIPFKMDPMASECLFTSSSL